MIQDAVYAVVIGASQPWPKISFIEVKNDKILSYLGAYNIIFYEDALLRKYSLAHGKNKLLKNLL